MTRFLTAALIATVGFGTVAVAGENPHAESRKKIEQALGKYQSPAESNQVSVTRGDTDQRVLVAPEDKGDRRLYDWLRSVQPDRADK